MIQAYIDESGMKGTDPVLVLAGFIAKAEDWTAFSEEWNTALLVAPSIRYLKMYEADRLAGEFRGWTPEARDKKLHELVEIIKRHPYRAIHCTVDLAAYELQKFERPMRDPYYFGFNVIVAGVCFDVIDLSQRDEVELIFDENLIFGPRVSLWYPAIKDMFLQQAHPDHRELAEIMPSMPLFRKDETCPPLQAADVLAWLIRNAMSGNRNQYEWIATELAPVIQMSVHSSMFDEKRLRLNNQASMVAQFPNEQIEKWRMMLGVKVRKEKKRKKV